MENPLMAARDADSRPDPERELSVAERELSHATALGTLVDLQVGAPERDDPERGLSWGPERMVRAELLFGLLTGERPPIGGRPRAVKLRGARITDTLDLAATELVCPLLLSDCYFDQPINLNEASAPAVRLPGCRLPGLTADQLRTTGNLDLNAGFTVAGQVSLIGARVGGRLSLHGAHLSNPGGLALWADGLTVEEGMFCRDGFTCDGEINLASARIGGQMIFSQAHLANHAGPALYGLRLTVGGDLYCDDGFTAHGEVLLTGAHIGGRFDLDGATLTNTDGRALSADGLTVAGALTCRDGFTADGEINLMGARIGGALDLKGASLHNPGGTALHLEAARAQALFLRPRRQIQGAIDVTNAGVTNFGDDVHAWPDTVHLRGFTYQTLDDAHHARVRLRWLARHPGGYTPQIYDQLTSAYRAAGNEESARTVAIAKQWRKRSVLGTTGKLANWLLYVTIGYGYRTWLAVVWLAGLLACGTWIFDRAYPADMARAEARGQAFHAVAYTLDVLVPIVDLGQQKAWQPQGAAMYWSWTFMGAGWLLTTAVAAGLTGLARWARS
jgi:hypothetical protein